MGCGQFRVVLERFAALGLEVHLTELDVVPTDPNVLAAADPAAALAEIYAGVVTGCLAVPACRCVSTWGFTDQFNRWAMDAPLAPPGAFYYDADLRPKAAREAGAQVLGEAAMQSPGGAH